MTDKETQLKLLNKGKEIKELHVLIDTLQTNLRSALTYLNEEQLNEITKVPSMKWCMRWNSKDSMN